jgi:hypothetical protein
MEISTPNAWQYHAGDGQPPGELPVSRVAEFVDKGILLPETWVRADQYQPWVELQASVLAPLIETSRRPEDVALSLKAYRDPTNRAGWARSSLIALMGVLALGILVSWSNHDFAKVMVDAKYHRFEQWVQYAPVRSMIYGLLQILTVVMGWFCAIVMLSFQFRLVSNARSFGASRFDHSPWGLMIWYVVPIASLFVPYSIISDTWRASAGTNPWRHSSVPNWFLGWWWAFLASLVVLQLSNLNTQETPNAREFATLNLWLIARNAVALVACWLALRFVREFTARQTQGHERLRAVAALATPGSGT